MRQYREPVGKAPSAARRKAEAIRYAEAIRGLNDNPIVIARAHASPDHRTNGSDYAIGVAAQQTGKS